MERLGEGKGGGGLRDRLCVGECACVRACVPACVCVHM